MIEQNRASDNFEQISSGSLSSTFTADLDRKSFQLSGIQEKERVNRESMPMLTGFSIGGAGAEGKKFDTENMLCQANGKKDIADDAVKANKDVKDAATAAKIAKMTGAKVPSIPTIPTNPGPGDLLPGIDKVSPTSLPNALKPVYNGGFGEVNKVLGGGGTENVGSYKKIMSTPAHDHWRKDDPRITLSINGKDVEIKMRLPEIGDEKKTVNVYAGNGQILAKEPISGKIWWLTNDYKWAEEKTGLKIR